jgi:hypothetical protein
MLVANLTDALEDIAGFFPDVTLAAVVESRGEVLALLGGGSRNGMGAGAGAGAGGGLGGGAHHPDPKPTLSAVPALKRAAASHAAAAIDGPSRVTAVHVRGVRSVTSVYECFGDGGASGPTGGLVVIVVSQPGAGVAASFDTSATDLLVMPRLPALRTAAGALLLALAQA